MEVRRFDLDNVTVFFAQRAVADEGCETEVEQLGEGAGFRGVGVQETGAVEFAQNGGELFEEDALKVDVLLVRADDVGSGGEGVAVAVAGGGERCGMDMVGCLVGGDHFVIALPSSSTLAAQRARALER